MPDNTVPSSGQAGTVNPAEILSSIFAKNQGDLSKAALAASTPIPGAHATQMPLSMQQGPGEAHPGQLDHREVVGKGNARAQGIGNSVIGVMNLLGSTEKALDNKKKLEIASSTQQLLTAQQAYDQAAELYKQNPQNTDAKAAMERNKGVMNGILSNDKIRKAIAKGMNVDFTDPKANDTLEHQGVSQGKDMAKAHLSYADQFNEKTPQAMQPNQQAIAQYQALKDQQKMQVDTMKAMIPLINAQMRQQDVKMQIEGRMNQEEFKQSAANARTLVESQDKWERLNQSIAAKAQLAKSEFGYKLAEISAEGTKELSNFRAKMQMKTADPTTQVKAYEDFQTKAASTVDNLTKNISALEARRYDTNSKTAPSTEEIPHLNDQISIAKQALSSYQDTVKATQDYYNAFKLKGGPDGSGTGSTTGESGSSSSTSKTLGNASTYLNAPTDSTAEDNSDDDFDLNN